MATRRHAIALGVLGALALGADHAAGALTLSGSTFVITCTTPTTAQCADPVFIRNAQGAYCESSWKSSCAAQLNSLATGSTPLAGRSFDAAGTARKAKIMTTAPVTNLKYGTAASFAPKAYSGDLSLWSGWEAKAKWDASQGAAIADKVNYVRYPGWELNKDFLTSCQKYTYDSFYDIERWLDSVNACRGDKKCIVNVSFAPTDDAPPRIAPVNGVARVLKDRQGKAILDRIAQLKAGQQIDAWAGDPFSPGDTLADLPKNAFYAGTEYMFVPALISAFKAAGKDIQPLLNELHRGGRDYYAMYQASTTGGNWVSGSNYSQQGFRDEWDFHETMNKRTQLAPDGSPMTDDDYAEYQARNKRVERALDIAYHQLKCTDVNLPTDCKELPNAVGHVNPGDEVIREDDDLLMRGIYGHVDPMRVIASPSMTSLGQFSLASGLSTYGMTGLDVGFLPQPGATTTMMSYTRPIGTRSSIGSFHLPGLISSSYTRVARVGATTDVVEPIAVFSLGGYLNQMWTAAPPKIDATAPYPRLDCGAATGPSLMTMTDGTNSRTVNTAYGTFCNAVNVILDEWGKKLQSKPSCLDRYGYYCDWSPDLFVQRYVSKHLTLAAAAKEAEFTYCKNWTGGGNFYSTDPNVGVPTEDRKALSTFRTFIEERRAKYLALTKNVPVRDTDDFGTDKSDARSIGGDFLGGGYSYKFGWNAKLDRYKPDGSNRVCRMQGKVYGGFHADATVIGEKFNVADAALSVSVNDGWQGKVNVFGQVRVGKTEFLPSELGSFDSDGKQIGGYEIALNQDLMRGAGDESDFPLISVPFQVGWFTVTLSAGIGYRMSVLADFKANASTTCDANTAGQPPFSVHAGLTPDASVYATASADVSLLGLIGAGVEGEVTLLGIGAPVYADVKVAEHSKDSTKWMALDFDLGLDLDVHALDGKLKAYVELFGIDIVKVPIVSWDGLHWRTQIFHTPPASVPLSFLNATVTPMGPPAPPVFVTL